MRPSAFSSGDSGDTGDTAGFAASGGVPTTEKASGDSGDKSIRRAGSAMSPVSSGRVGTRGRPVFIGLSPLSPVVPTRNRCGGIRAAILPRYPREGNPR
jgi:hypothetical protein